MSGLAGCRIDLWVEPRDGASAVNPIIRSLLDDLTGAGALVNIRVPEHEVHDAARLATDTPPDLILLKTATTLGLSLATALERQDICFLNPAQATVLANDKAAVVARLAAAGLPVPPTWLSQPPAGDMPASDGRGWVSKPVRGIHGRGVQFHATFPDGPTLAAVDAAHALYTVDDGTRLIQSRIGGDEPDLKVYVAGDRCFAGTKPFSAESYASDTVQPEQLAPKIEALIQAAGQTLALTLFGVDLRVNDGQPVIIDVNPFPGYRGFPDAVVALRREIERALSLGAG